MFNNWKTTLTGAIFSIATYIVGIGGKLPSTRNDWSFFIAALAIAVLGGTAKDANVTGGTIQATDSEGDKLKPSK